MIPEGVINQIDTKRLEINSLLRTGKRKRKYTFHIILPEGPELIPHEISKFRFSPNLLDCPFMCRVSIEFALSLFVTHLAATGPGAWRGAGVC